MPETAKRVNAAPATELPTAAPRQPSSPSLRRLPVRMTEPPFDDDDGADARASAERTGDESAGGDSTQGALALAFALPTGVPAVPIEPVDADAGLRRLRLVPPLAAPGAPDAGASPRRAPGRPGRRRTTRGADVDDFGPQRTPRSLLPEPRPWAGRLVQAIVEVGAGVRPVAQLVRWTTSEVYESVYRRTAHFATMRDHHRAGAIVRSVHVDEPSDGVAEVCAVVQHGNRCRAVALRLEGVDGRWQCTALQVG